MASQGDRRTKLGKHAYLTETEENMANSTSLSSSFTTKTFRVALFVGSEVMARGLEAVLLKAANVGSVTQVDYLSLPELFEGKAIDILIVSIDRWSLLDEFPEITASIVKILVVGDGLHNSDPKLLSTLPANGFATMEDLSSDSACDTLDRIRHGEMPMPPELARRLLSGAQPVAAASRRASVSLTAREKETLTLLVKGMSNKELARALGISMHGAKRLVTAIMLKLRVPNRTAAVVEAIQSGLIEILLTRPELFGW
jgi:two-component system nitrate/nitrite response regulator NarL